MLLLTLNIRALSDIPDVTLSDSSTLYRHGVRTMSAVAFASVHLDHELAGYGLGHIVRTSITYYYVAKFQAITYLKELTDMLTNRYRKNHRLVVLRSTMFRDPLQICLYREPAPQIQQMNRRGVAGLKQGSEIANADNIFNFAMRSPFLRKMLNKKLVPEPDLKATPIKLSARLGKPVFAISPQQYEEMRKVNDFKKAKLRILINAPEVLPEDN